MTTPSLKITALHLEHIPPIHRVDWETAPSDTLIITGPNGSGKSALLRFLAGAWSSVRGVYPSDLLGAKESLAGVSAAITFALTCEETGSMSLEFVLGDAAFVRSRRSPAAFGFELPRGGVVNAAARHEISRLLSADGWFGHSTMPRLLFVPSEDRALAVPEQQFKSAGRLKPDDAFVHRWHRADRWDDSLEALLYSARWEDLNAKEEDRPGDACHFRRFTDAFEPFLGTAKRLTWRKGELLVEIPATGATHDLDRLSSGEKQILLVVTELIHRWKPGSLVLLDEPELHLNPRWQRKLWDLLCRLQAERGGQLVMATQSAVFLDAVPASARITLAEATTAG